VEDRVIGAHFVRWGPFWCYRGTRAAANHHSQQVVGFESDEWLRIALYDNKFATAKCR